MDHSPMNENEMKDIGLRTRADSDAHFASQVIKGNLGLTTAEGYDARKKLRAMKLGAVVRRGLAEEPNTLSDQEVAPTDEPSAFDRAISPEAPRSQTRTQKVAKFILRHIRPSKS